MIQFLQRKLKKWANRIQTTRFLECFRKKFISSNKDNIGLMLLPHHGSKFGWNNKLLNLANNFVVSYGLGNTHKHPHSQVTNKILLSKKHHKNLLEVNQNKNSILGITIY